MQDDSVTVVIADDDPTQLQHLVALTRKLRPQWQIVAQATSSADAITAIREHAPTLCLLDVELSDATGIDIAQTMQSVASVIFVSGHSGYAADAFDCAAVDFVKKPVRTERLEMAFKKAEQTFAQRAADGSTAGATPRASLVRFTRGRDLVMAPLEQVCFFQAQHKYTRVVLMDGEGLLRMNLSASLQHLDAQKFWRVHRSYIVNTAHVLSSNRDEFHRIVLKLKDRNEKIIVSKPYEHLFLKDGFS